jgi:glyoxylase-like metal-dependent hydrolase (beta-lactamase superfamily II)
MKEEDYDVDVEAPNMEIRSYVVSPISTNCYVVVSDGHAMVIDPGASGKELAEELKDVKVDLIVATHGHGDHVGGVKALKDATGALFAIGENDAERATHAGGVGNLGIAYDDDAPMADILLSEGDTVSVGDVSFDVLDTPGHTEGGIVLLGNGVAFTGDTLFKGTAGRTDFPGGDAETLMESLAHLIDEIPPETVVLAGHGEPTTMEVELETNPFLIELS